MAFASLCVLEVGSYVFQGVGRGGAEEEGGDGGRRVGRFSAGEHVGVSSLQAGQAARVSANSSFSSTLH